MPAPLPLSGTKAIVTQITAHKLVAPIIIAALKDIYDAGLWDDLHCYGGGFNWRPQRGSHKPSLHSWGLAWDFDPENNALGTRGHMNPLIVEHFKRHGFFWGGDFHGRPDPMHVQFATGF